MYFETQTMYVLLFWEIDRNFKNKQDPFQQIDSLFI